MVLPSAEMPPLRKVGTVERRFRHVVELVVEIEEERERHVLDVRGDGLRGEQRVERVGLGDLGVAQHARDRPGADVLGLARVLRHFRAAGEQRRGHREDKKGAAERRAHRNLHAHCISHSQLFQLLVTAGAGLKFLRFGDVT